MKEQDYIYTIYTEQSFSKAAQKLYISQPALSMAVKKVETDLGITIFDRSTVPLTLTDEGRIYMNAVEEIRSVNRTMLEKLTDMSDLRSGRLTVSGENFVSSFILPEVLMRFLSEYSGIDVQIVESNLPDLREALLSESIDLLIAHDFNSTQYEAKELFDEKVLLAVPEKAEINNIVKEFSMSKLDVIKGVHKTKKAVDLKLFANEEFLMMKPGNDMQRRSAQICGEAGFIPKARVQLDQLITAYNLACKGMGIAFVSDILIEKANSGGCVYYNLASGYAHRKMHIGYKKHRYLNKAATAFIETAVNVFKER